MERKLIFGIESIKLSNIKYNLLTSLVAGEEPLDESLTITNEKCETLTMSNAHIPKTQGVLKTLGNIMRIFESINETI